MLVAEADAALTWDDDAGSARRLLEKVLRIRPSSQDALERLAALHIRGRRLAEGLATYDRLVRPPSWPPLTYMAAVAACELRRFDASQALAQEFLRASARLPELAKVRSDARKLAARSAREARALRAPAPPVTSRSPRLPWNPMQLEQRVGRVHRIGQTRELFVFNLCLAGSLEEYMLKVLYDKLNLFELVAGEIEMILGELDPDQDFAAIVMDLWARSATRADREEAFRTLADALVAARARYERTQALDRGLFSEEYEV